MTDGQMHIYDTRTGSDYHQYRHLPTAAGCDLCNKLPTYVKQIRNNFLFKRTFSWKGAAIE